MLEILKRQTVAANRLLLKDRMSGDVPGTVTAIDRETNTMIICPADADSGLDSLVLLPLDEDYKGIQNIDFPHDIVLHAALYRKYPEIVSSFLTMFLLIFPSKNEISKSSIIRFVDLPKTIL